MKKILRYLFVFGLVLVLGGCDDGFLDKKPNKGIVVPTTVEDLQAILDNAQVMNVVPALGLAGTDDLFTNDAGYAFLTQPAERNAYTWAKDFYQGAQMCEDWNVPYQQVFYANVVLEQLGEIQATSANEVALKQLKGSALFYRGHAFYQLAQLFAAPYPDENGTLGIPLRLTADVNAPVKRASLHDTYERIVADLLEAKDLLPVTSSYKTRPSQVACNALLARVYLTMQDYDNAERYADAVLLVAHTLIDYNTLTTTAPRPVPPMNEETLFYSYMVTYRFTTSPYSFVDTLLYASYDENDLRKEVFFRQRDVNRFTFKGNYTGTAVLFGGIATDEIYLIRAECRVRNGNIEGALDDVNTLLSYRFVTGTYSNITETGQQALLAIILKERQKELVFRGTRWSDLRRLNQEDVFAVTLERKLDGIDYLIVPNDVRYVLPIPIQEVFTSGVEQSER